MKTENSITIDLNLLPDSAREKLVDYYLYLFDKYGLKKKKQQNGKILNRLLPKPVKAFKPFIREEIYGR
ncbi:MAG: hypothetical protein EPN82_11600 [Bacteroidetes bacterium]|nr:MAG: hypothetical protein EPN82_11600 [Bacteroidota bacterium]